MANKIDSNVTSFAFNEESAFKTVGTGPWYGLDVNIYSDFGAQIDKISREPINGTRQRLKGSVNSVVCIGAFNVDITRSALSRLMQGFFYKSVSDFVSTTPINGASTPITAVAAGSGVYSAAAGLSIFSANQLVNCTGFTNSANNGVFKVISATATTLTLVNSASVAEAAPPAAAKIEVIGYEFGAGTLAMSVTAAAMTLTASAGGGAALNVLQAGQWVFIGGDAALTAFATGGTGFARVLSSTATTAVFDKTTFTPVADAGATKTIRIYYSSIYNNATSYSGISVRSYQLERQLGSDGNGTQSEYIVGAVPNELDINFKNKDKITADMKFIAMGYESRIGSIGVKTGTRTAINPNETGYSSSLDVYRAAIAPYSTTLLNSPAIVGYLTDIKFSIKNNANIAEAIGETTGFDVNLGNFDVSADSDGYFTTLSAVNAISSNTDVTMDIIISSPNGDGTYHGKVIDLPLMEIGNGKLAVVKDQAIKIPLTSKGLKSTLGYTASWSEFKILPAIAAPL
jgi:hypothetical protein